MNRFTIATMVIGGISLLFWGLWHYLAKPKYKKLYFSITFLFSAFAIWVVLGKTISFYSAGETIISWVVYKLSLLSYAWLATIGISVVVLLVLLLVRGAVAIHDRKASEEEKASRRKLLQKTAFSIPLLILGGASAASFEGDSYLAENHHELLYPKVPLYLKNYKIAQISDVHLGPFFDIKRWDAMMDRILKEKPNRLVITGDLIDEIDYLPELCERLEWAFDQFPDGIDYIYGNHEYFRDFKKIEKAFADIKMRVLRNQHINLTERGNGVYLVGVDYPGNKESERTREAFMERAMKGIDRGAFVILLAHHPEFIEDAFARNIQLTLAGHSHGGQVNFFGKSLLPFSYPYWRGLYKEKGNYGYVSTGTGHWFPLRVNCPREITFFTFKEEK